jgi:hypothetical protein
MSDRGRSSCPALAHSVAENEDCRAIASAKANFRSELRLGRPVSREWSSLNSKFRYQDDASIALGIYIDCGILPPPIDLSSPSLTASNSAMQKPGSKGMNVTYAYKLLVAGDQQRHGFVQRSPDSRANFSCMGPKIVLPEDAA